MNSAPQGRETLEAERALRLARDLVREAGAGDRVEASLDPRDGALVVTGRHGMGFFGTPMFVPLRLGARCTARAVAVAVARHVLEDPYSDEKSLCTRANELPLGLALLLAG